MLLPAGIYIQVSHFHGTFEITWLDAISSFLSSKQTWQRVPQCLAPLWNSLLFCFWNEMKFQNVFITKLMKLPARNFGTISLVLKLAGRKSCEYSRRSFMTSSLALGCSAQKNSNSEHFDKYKAKFWDNSHIISIWTSQLFDKSCLQLFKTHVKL